MRTRQSLGILLAIFVAGSGVASAQTTHDNRFGRLNPQAPPETAQWGQLAGVWDCTLRSVTADSTIDERKATWTWAYVIDGHAVQDVYIGPRPAGPAFHGSGMRKYNPTQQRWEIIWIDSNPRPANRGQEIRTYSATYVNEQIVMRQDGDSDWRTVFYDITGQTFEWMNEPSQQRMRCERADVLRR